MSTQEISELDSMVCSSSIEEFRIFDERLSEISGRVEVEFIFNTTDSIFCLACSCKAFVCRFFRWWRTIWRTSTKKAAVPMARVSSFWYLIYYYFNLEVKIWIFFFLFSFCESNNFCIFSWVSRICFMQAFWNRSCP